MCFNTKKIISVLLTISMFFSVFVLNANAKANSTGEWYGILKFDKDKKAITDCAPDAINVVIPSEIDGISVESIESYAFAANKNIESVIVPNGIKTISDHTFNVCSNLKKVNLPDSIEEIGYGAFFWCTNLREINMPKNLKKIDAQAFEGCKSLNEVILPNGFLEIWTSAFASCNSLKKVLIPSSVTFINNGSFTIKDSPSLVIFGAVGSKAEDYAKGHTIPFESIGGLVIEGENSVQKDKEIVLKATRYDEKGNVAPEGSITWSCSDESVAQISPWGNNVTVKGLKGGKVTITATHAASGQKADFEIEVVSYVMTLGGGYTVMLDEELEINYAVKQGEEYVHNELDIKWEIESKNSNKPIEFISEKKIHIQEH